MPTIPPATAVAPTAPVAPSGGNNIIVETTVNSAPDKIQQLSRQIEVSGLLAQAPDNATVILNTVIGPLTLVLPQLAQAQQDKLLQQLLQLYENQKPLTVVLQPGNPPAQAILLLPPLTSSLPNTVGAGTSTSATPLLPNLPPLVPNLTLAAVVLPKATGFSPGASAQAAEYANLSPLLHPELSQANTSLPLPLIEGAPVTQMLEKEIVEEVLSKLNEEVSAPPLPTALANPPGSQTLGPSPLSGSPLSATPLSAPSSTLPTLSSLSGNLADLLQPGKELTLQVNAVLPPLAQSLSPPPALQPNQILATVTGTGPAGQLILQANDTTFFVRQPVNAQIGAQLLVTVSPAQVDAPAPLALPPDQQTYTALQQIISAMTQADPSAARSIISNHIPQPTEGLTGAMLFFLNAVRQGDVRGWLGAGAIDLLTRAGKAELVSKLAQELQKVGGQVARDTLVGEWRSYSIPLHDPTTNHINIMHLYVHADRQHRSSQEREDPQASPHQVRFLIDIRMSRLGNMQLDGFLRQMQLDIILRSETSLPPGLERDLRDTYTNTLSAIGYRGGMNFQHGRQGWLNPQKPAQGAAMVT